MSRYKRKGWFFESNRHSLARKGICTKKYKQPKEDSAVSRTEKLKSFLSSAKEKLFPPKYSEGGFYYTPWAKRQRELERSKWKEWEDEVKEFEEKWTRRGKEKTEEKVKRENGFDREKEKTYDVPPHEYRVWEEPSEEDKATIAQKFLEAVEAESKKRAEEERDSTLEEESVKEKPVEDAKKRKSFFTLAEFLRYYRNKGNFLQKKAPIRTDITKNYIRRRMIDPNKFQKGSFRIIDPGRKGHTKLVIGRLKGSKTTTVQSVLQERNRIRRQ
jgi:hypothetical protein